jgi:hypothetical protein
MSDAYANRTDLNNAVNRIPRQAATGQTYGKATEQMEAQRAVPMGAPPTETGAAPRRPVPGTLGSLTRRSERPGEPITAGAPFGAGLGPESMGVGSATGNPAIDELRMIYQMFPNDDLADLLDAYSREGF